MTSARQALVACSALVVGACGRLDVHLGDGRARIVSDAGQDASDAASVPAADASFDAGAVPSGFGKPVVITSLSNDSSVDDDPSLTGDRLVVFFDSKRDGGQGKEDIFASERKDAQADWDTPTPVESLNTADRETGIALSADGLRIWFSSDRPESQGGLDVFTAQRTSRSAAWSAVTRVDELSTPDDDLVSDVNDAETVCLLGRRPKGTDNYDMYVSTRATADDPWQPAEPIQELDTKANESDAFLAGDGYELLFTRSKDLQFARRPAQTAPFVLVGPLDDLNSSSDDRDPWATQDLRYVVFSSNRSGSYELYEASR
ncbi:MAG TPA: hypothetical protein VHC69_13305 [Polyangiaceae bacterium]|nr:hypothetical protein [Polyangiaceae bacterium]